MRRPAGFLCALALVLSAACSEPPQKEIDRAQGATEAARAAGAERYAPTEFTAATTALKEAHEAVAQRDYRLALSKALEASERAQQAAREAADSKARARSDAEKTIAFVTTSLQELQTAIKGAGSRVPPAQIAQARRVASSVEGALQKAGALLASDQYLEALDALKGLDAQIAEQITAFGDAGRPRTPRRLR